MIVTEFDEPEPQQFRCRLCEKPFMAKWYWVYDRWLRPTVHDQCAEKWSKAEKARLEAPEAKAQPMPDRFLGFNPTMADARALSLAQAFSPDSDLRTLAIIGVPAMGKSRIMWAVIQQFFDDLEAHTGARRWVDYHLFSDLALEQDKSVIAKIKMARYVFIDDVGSVATYGRDKSNIQALIRARLQNQQWTFLTIDNLDFDTDLKDALRGRAVDIWIDQ